jgi:hypothetical protein
LLFNLKQRLFFAISEAPHLHTAVIRSIAQKPVIVEGQQSDLALSGVAILNFGHQTKSTLQSEKAQAATPDAFHNYCQDSAIFAEADIGELVRRWQMLIQP